MRRCRTGRSRSIATLIGAINALSLTRGAAGATSTISSDGAAPAAPPVKKKGRISEAARKAMAGMRSGGGRRLR